MTVYLIQKLDWRWNDEAFVLREDTPVKAFASRRDAEALCTAMEAQVRAEWRGYRENDTYIGENGRGNEVERFYEVIALELEP